MIVIFRIEIPLISGLMSQRSNALVMHMTAILTGQCGGASICAIRRLITGLLLSVNTSVQFSTATGVTA